MCLSKTEVLIVVSFILASTVLGTELASAAPQWPQITREAKPWAYNWWMASAVDREGLEAQCAAMEEAGLGGFHVIPIYGAKGYEAKYRKYLSPEWMQAFGDAVEIAARHGLGVDMTMGNGWCFGGPQLKSEQGCWKLVKTADGKPPYVTWKLTGQKVKRAGPGGQGPMMDPFSIEAIDAFMAPYAVFDEPGAAKPLHVYHDSWEYYSAGWTPKLFDAFRAKRGYDLRDHLKELAGIGDPEAVAKLKCDYRETLSDLVIEDVFPRWVDWAHRRGVKVRNEAHGTCANWLDFYALADVPETEMYSEECRDILISKFASSAAHVTGKRLVASESCTWLGEHFTETLADFKVFIDRLLLSGVNHMFYHGCCYSPVDAVWPGWCFYASSEMNPRNPVWRDAKYLNAYVARVQAMFQACEPDNDTLVYWPLRDYWWDAEGFEKMMTLHDADKWFHAQPIGEVARRLYAEGCCFDYVSDRQLQELDLSRYAHVVVPPCRHMPERTRAAIARFRERPVRIEPFAAAGLAFSRHRRGDETVYFIVNTNATRFAATLTPAAKGEKWWMDPMTGRVRPASDRVELEPYESGFLVVKGNGPRSRSLTSGEDTASPFVELAGPWTLMPICGGPELPPSRTMDRLTTWSRKEDGTEEPFSGTMRYRTEFEWTEKTGDGAEVELDLGEVSQSAVVRINGADAGFAIMAPYRTRFPASLLKAGRNLLEVEVTSTGANRIRWNGQNGVNWRYFNDVNVLSYVTRGQLDQADRWPLREYGLLGPVRLTVLTAREPGTVEVGERIWTVDQETDGLARLTFISRSPDVTTFEVVVNGQWVGSVPVPPSRAGQRFEVSFDAVFAKGPNVVRISGKRLPESIDFRVVTPVKAEGLETEKWQELIDRTAARGGGRVTIPAGRHLVGGLELRDNVELHLEKDAVLEGACGLENYRIWSLPCSEGTWSAVVAGVGVTNVSITGEGEIFGNGGAWPLPSYSGANQEGLRPRGVFLSDARDVSLEGFLLRDAACWGVVFKCVDGLRVRGVRIDNHANYNNDGFDIEARNAVFEGCDVDASDDAFVFKSNNPDFVTENILVTNCLARSHCYAYKFGTASHGTMRNVRIVCSKALPPQRDFLAGENPGPDGAISGKPFWFRRMGYDRYPSGCGGGSLAVECVDGGMVENILFENMELSGATVPLFVRGGTRTGRHNGVPAGNRHILRNVVFRNIRGEAAGWIASSITGVRGCRAENITLENVNILCRGAGKELSAKALTKPVPDVSGCYPSVSMFRHILPAYGLYIDQADGVTLQNAVFRLSEGECDVRPSIAYGKSSRPR